MIRYLIVAVLCGGVIAAGAGSEVIAQAPANQHALSTVSLQAQLKDEIARMTSLSPNDIQVHATNAMIRVVLVNTGYNDDPPTARQYLASTVSALVNKNAEKDSRFKPVVVLHVEFVKRRHGFTKFVETMEFRKGADGSFARHQT